MVVNFGDTRDIVPIFATRFANLTYTMQRNKIVHDGVKWRYGSVLIAMVEMDTYGLILKEYNCPFCDYSPPLATSIIIHDRMKFIQDEEARIVSWVVPGEVRRVQLLLNFREEYETFTKHVQNALHVGSGTHRSHEAKLAECWVSWTTLFRQVEAPSYDMHLLRMGQPSPEDIEIPCMCAEICDEGVSSLVTSRRARSYTL